MRPSQDRAVRHTYEQLQNVMGHLDHMIRTCRYYAHDDTYTDLQRTSWNVAGQIIATAVHSLSQATIALPDPESITPESRRATDPPG